jgi:hypothetical protein
MSGNIRPPSAAGYWPWPVACRVGRLAAASGRSRLACGRGRPRSAARPCSWQAPVRGRPSSVAGFRPPQASFRGRLLSVAGFGPRHALTGVRSRPEHGRGSLRGRALFQPQPGSSVRHLKIRFVNIRLLFQASGALF